MDKQEFLRLLDKYLDGKASEDESRLLDNYFNSFQQSDQWIDEELGSRNELGSRMLHRIEGAIQKQNEVPVIPLYKRNWFKTASAAIVLFAVGTTIWWSVQKKTELSTTKTIAANKTLSNEITGDHIVLMLNDGKVINLDKASNGVLTQQGTTEIIKQDSQIVFEQTPAKDHKTEKAIEYNTVSIPRGARFKVVLPDGTKVWLNTASSLRFPAVFPSGERKVELNGEAYFEVAKNASKPFRVFIKEDKNTAHHGAMIEVLGTHFNINAYPDEEVHKTTLLEGSVRVVPVDASASQKHNTLVLKPGQQAQIDNHSSVSNDIQVQNVDTEEAVAWKSNMFSFNRADIQTIMRQIERWYNVSVTYDGPVPLKNFSGKISRSSDLPTVLKIISQSGIHFHLEGKKIIVRS